MKKIPFELYKKIVDVLPILCVDILLKYDGKYILVKRKNEPVKDFWWPPGGRVLKGETIENAAKRKIKEELGVEAEILKVQGYYEAFFKESAFESKSGTHSLSIVVLAKPPSSDFKLDSQSSGWRFSKTLPKNFKIKTFAPRRTLFPR